MNKNFHIEKSDSFRVVGFLIQTTNQRREGRKAIPAHWARFKAENLEQPLLALADLDKKGATDDSYIRKAAIKEKIPYMTTMAAAKATAEGIKAVKMGERLEVHSLQEFHKKIKE